jgi:hypothetical protein
MQKLAADDELPRQPLSERQKGTDRPMNERRQVSDSDRIGPRGRLTVPTVRTGSI